ncbi:hypothetical protein C2869_00575 [Saccharobesus litoralis]|uniref:histidine kinase n=1 Tax=Saccharobesus litoralis TaxID=2172099 RepID=A0A2S0VLF0_9ALTE|nr:ATP-binding protein [Saccharobesus litoralis]AWB65026.1 hypothetical protein C2869_00575 [Saccharobesus litoralis]
MKLQHRFQLALSALIILTLLVTGALIYQAVESTLIEYNKKQLLLQSQMIRSHIDSNLNQVKENLRLLSSRTQMRRLLASRQVATDESQISGITAIINDALKASESITRIDIHNAKGIVLATTSADFPHPVDLQKLYAQASLSNAEVSDSVSLNDSQGANHIMTVKLYWQGSVVGFLSAHLTLQSIYHYIDIAEKYDEATKIYLLSKINDEWKALNANYITQPQSNIPVGISPEVMQLEDEKAFNCIDSKGKQYTCLLAKAKAFNFKTLVVNNTGLMLSHLTKIKWLFIGILIASSLASLLLASYLTKRFSRTFAAVAKVAHQIVDDKPTSKIEVAEHDELASLAHDINSITEKVAARNLMMNQALVDKNEQLCAESQRADEAELASYAFLARMSYKIRTPLNGIDGVTLLLKNTELTPKQSEYCNTIEKCSESLLSLLNDVLDTSNLKLGKLTLVPTMVDIRNFFSELQQQYAKLFKEKTLSLQVSIADDVPSYLEIDPLRFSQLITKLINNALKYTEFGHVIISLDCLSKSAQGCHLQLNIEDTGVGIDDELLPHVCNAFVQENAEVVKNYGGHGLGLTIAKHLVELMQGHLEVESTKGSGTLIKINLQLPFVTKVTSSFSPYNEGTEGTDDAERTGVSRLVNCRILLVEDNLINQEVAVALLEQLGASVPDIANDGYDAIQSIKENSYDLILMDINMPNLDGYQATQKIRAMEDITQPIIVALTANVLPENVEKYLNNGFDAHIAKPIHIDEFSRVLERVLQLSTVK